MDELTTENKLVMGYLFNLKCLDEGERSREIKDLLSKGYSYGKLSALLNIPKSTLMGWGNPASKKNYYEQDITLTNIKKEIDKRYKLTSIPGKNTDDGAEFKEIATLNFQLRNILNILKDIKEVNNDIANKLFKEIKIEVRRLNGKEKESVLA